MNKVSPIVFVGLDRKSSRKVRELCRPTEQVVMNYFLQKFCVTHEKLITKSRKQPLPECRRLIVYFTKRYVASMTWKRLAKLVGCTDHSTAMVMMTVVRDQCEVDKVYRKKVEEYNKELSLLLEQ